MSPTNTAECFSSARPLALTLPSTRPKTTRSPATMSAWITPLAPTVNRLPVRVMLPSSTPSRKKSSSPVTSPRMQIPLPITVPELLVMWCPPIATTLWAESRASNHRNVADGSFCDTQLVHRNLMPIQGGKRKFLPARLLKVGGREPLFEACPAPGPFRVQHGKPGRIAVAPLDDHVLAKQSLEDKAQAQRRAAGRFV